MTKVLIIPDVHGLSFWKQPCYNWEGPIIFLGDYTDPYWPTTQEEAFSNLKDLVEFKNSTKNTCKFLLGNHDFFYITGFAACRADYEHKQEIRSLLDKLDLSLCTTIKTENKEYLFSHAGITKEWLGKLDYLDKEFVVPKAFKKLNSKLMQVPYSRGGDSMYGSCIWNSISDFDESTYMLSPNMYQIFGHTWAGRTEPVITDNYAMLDCHKAFVLDLNTGKIEEW